MKRPVFDGECPRCQDNLTSYMPFVEGSELEIEIECENCGYYVILHCSLLRKEIKND